MDRVGRGERGDPARPRTVRPAGAPGAARCGPRLFPRGWKSLATADSSRIPGPVGFLAKLFGQPPRRPANPARPASTPVSPQSPAAAAPAPVAARLSELPALPESEIRRRTAEALAHLEAGRVAEAMPIYEKLVAEAGAQSGVLAEISADLGRHGELEGIVSLLAPIYDPRLHGAEAGLNLLQAYLQLGHDSGASHLLDLLRDLGRDDLAPRLRSFAGALEELRRGAESGAAMHASAGPVGGAEREGPDVNLVTFSKPIWIYAQPEGEALLPAKTGRERRLALLPLAVTWKESEPPPADAMVARLARSLPLALAEACWFSPAYRPVGVAGVDPKKRLFVPPRPFGSQQIADLFAGKDDPQDFAVAGSVRALQVDRHEVEFVVWDIKRHRELKRFGGAVGPTFALLLTYLEAEKSAPGSDGFAYALPTDVEAHCLALDQALHYFLAEKAVLPSASLGPVGPRFDELLHYARVHAAHPVAPRVVRACAAHARALGLAVPPGAAVL